jgi:capsular exopolysaccharide synthesis family protein
MSRLFEALQRSEPETFGFDFALPEPPDSELVKAAEAETLKPTEAEAPNPAETQIPEFGQFPSVPVSLSPGSRLASWSGREESSLGAEKFRFLAVRLRQIRRGRDFKKLLITSTIPGEGKSTVSANLAITLAHRKQQKILLVDGDLRRPVLAHEFGLGDQAGLSECLRGEPRPITNIYRLETAGLWFLPAGRPPENPLDLMQSGRLSDLLDQLTAWFDWIVIDSPPVLPLGDTSVWTRLVDGVLLVAREGTTEKRQLQRGLEALDQSKLLGMVLNSCSNADHSSYYQRYASVAPPPQDKVKAD